MSSHWRRDRASASLPIRYHEDRDQRGGEDEHHPRERIATEDHRGHRQRDHPGQDELGQIGADIGIQCLDPVGQESDELARAPAARRHRALIDERGEDPAANLVFDSRRRPRPAAASAAQNRRRSSHDGGEQPAETRRHRRAIRAPEKDLGNDVRQQPRLDDGHQPPSQPKATLITSATRCGPGQRRGDDDRGASQIRIRGDPIKQISEFAHNERSSGMRQSCDASTHRFQRFRRITSEIRQPERLSIFRNAKNAKFAKTIAEPSHCFEPSQLSSSASDSVVAIVSSRYEPRQAGPRPTLRAADGSRCTRSDSLQALRGPLSMRCLCAAPREECDAPSRCSLRRSSRSWRSLR